MPLTTMSMTPLCMSIDELLGYTTGERDKWQQWFRTQPPAALEAPVQREGDFNDVWRLMDHIFLVEKRHTQRLKQESLLMEQTGVARPDMAALFGYGLAARDELTRFLQSAGDADLRRIIEFQYRDRKLAFTARKLAFHILFHEIRHWAQIATAVRNAGFPPPGFHDLVFTSAME
jgi:uncharacterized damage-inducible protein DinB